jgi:hypothetical protein
MALTGRCLCGAVSFTADDVETHFHACHCGMCRRWASGPVFAARAAAVKFAGEDNLKRYRSSDWAERGFCKNCGSNLFYYLRPASSYALSVGAFDDAAQFELAGEIFIDEKPGGYEIAGDHPRLTAAEVIARANAGD